MISLPDFSSLLASPWVTLITIAFGIVGVVGTVFGILMWRRGKEKLPYYAIHNDNIIRDLSSRFERLQMLWDGKDIRDFTATRLVFWNGGREPIRAGDVVRDNPIGVQVKEGCRILDASKLQDNNEDSRFDVSVTDDRLRAKCEFDFVERGQGVVMQVLHTGKSEDDIVVVGAVIGAGHPRRRPIFTDPKLRRQTKLRAVVFAGGVLGYVGMWYVLPAMLPLSLFSIAFLGAALVWDLSSLRMKKVPKGLEAFERS